MPADDATGWPAPAAGPLLPRRTVVAGLGALALTPGRRATASPQATPVQRARAFATGFNLPGVCDVPPDRAQLPSRQFLDRAARLGFRAVRLPIDPALCIGATRAFKRRLADVSARILEAGMALSLDLHAGGEVSDTLRSDPARGGELLVAAWRSLAPLAAVLPADRVMLEVLNEPPIPTDIWRPMRETLIAAIRGSAPDHTLVWSAAMNQTVEETVADPGPSDRNAIAAVHYYYPMVFTHQGQSWGDSPFAPIRELPFPFAAGDPQVAAIADMLRLSGRSESLAELQGATERPWTSERIDADFAALAVWSQTSGWPVVVNEFGVYRDYALEDSRARWIEGVRRAAERHGFGWCHWEIDAGFGFAGSRTDASSLDERIVAALLSAGAPANP